MMDEVMEAVLQDVAEAAAAYVLAVQRAHEATGRDMLEAWCARDAAFHDLVVTLGVECWMCDAGTCPGYIMPTGRGIPPEGLVVRAHVGSDVVDVRTEYL
jgi:hypothetical protein